MKNMIYKKRILRVIAIAMTMTLLFENVSYAALDAKNTEAAAIAADQTDAQTEAQAYGQDVAEAVGEETAEISADNAAADAGENDPGSAVSSDENIVSEEEITDGEVMDDTDEDAVDAEATISETGEETIEDDTDAAMAGPSDPVICVYDDETGHCRVEVEYTAEMFGLERAPKAVIKKVTAELPDIIRAAEEKNEGMQAEQVFAYDISFYDQDGNEVEPVDGKTVQLRFKNMDLEETGDTEIKAYHVDDEMQLDEVELTADGEDFVLDAESFSIFTIMVLRVLGTGKGIRNVKLLDFRETGHFGEAPQDVVIYSEDDSAACAPAFIWEPVNYYIYKLEVDADFVKDDYTNDRIVEFELAPGLRFNYDSADDIKSVDSSFESVEWVRYQDEGYDTENGIKNQEIRDTYSDNDGEPYNPRGGKVTIKIKGTVRENNYAKTLDLLVLAEKPLINYLGCKDGLTIEDAIKVRVSQGTVSLDNTEVDQDVTFMSDGKDYPHKSDYERGYFYGDHYGDQTKVPGEKTTMISSVFPTNYALTDNEYSEGVVMKKMALNFRADSSTVEFAVGEDSGFVLSTPEKRTEAGKDWWYYTAERNNIGLEYMAENKMPIDLQYTIPQTAAAGTVYNIEVLSTQEQWWDEDTDNEYSCSDYYEEKYRVFKVTVSGPGDFAIGFTGNTAVRDDTLHLQKGIVGSNEYHSMIAGTNLYKTGDVITPALYEVELPYNKMDIDAVGIPFNTNRDIEGYPTKLEFTDVNDQKITIERTVEDPSEYMGIIDDLAVKQYGINPQTSSYDTGIIVSREKLEDYYWEYYGEEIELGSLKSVKVWLPDFYQYKSLPRRSAYGVFYTAGAVYGRPLSSCAEGDTVRTVFKLSSTAAAPQFEAIELVQEYTVDFFGKDGDDYDGADTVYQPSVNMSASGTSFIPGDTVTFDIESWGENWNFGDEDKVWKPLLWISVPAGFDLVTSSAQFKYHTKSRVTNISYEKCNFTDVTSQAENVKPGWKVYELTFNETDVPFVGGLDKDWYCRYLSGSFSLKVLSTATNLEFAVSDYFFTGSELRNADAASIYSSDYTHEYEAGVHETVGNGYGLSSAEYIGCVRCDGDILVKSSPGVVIGAELKKQKFDNWTTFDENTDGLTLGNKESFNTRISIQNQTSRSCEKLAVYIPIPKENWIDILGTDRIGEFFTECNWDMYLTSCLYDQDASDAKFTVGYAQIQNKSEIHADGSVYPLGGWSSTFSTDTNFIKIELKEGESISNSDPVTYIPFEFSITTDKTKVDTSDKWKYAYSYEAGYHGTAVHSEKDSFGCILQNGKITGTIYLDKNYNGKKDELETTTVSGVTFTVSDGKNKYDATVFDNGNYEITGLPGSKKITITVTNPKDPDPSKDGSKRFTKKTDSTETVIGSDVTPNSTGKAATKTITSLAPLGGEAKVNIGFIEPLDHSVLADPEGWATVSPEYIRSYLGQTITDATKALSPQLPKVTTAATETHTGWKIYNTAYTDEELLAAAFNDEQTIYAVIQKTVKIKVTPKDNIEYDGKPVVASNEEPADIIYSYEGTAKANSRYYLDASGEVPTTAENSGALGEGRPPKWPGTYYIQVSVKESAPYSAAVSDFVRFEIKKKSLTKPSADTTSFVYDGEVKELQVNGFDKSTMTMKSGSTTSATNAGSYSVTYVLNDKTKYQWSDGTDTDVVIPWRITKAKVTKPSADKTSFDYDGEVKELQVKGFDESTMNKKAGTTSETNAGSYSVTYELKDKKNYEWSTGGTSDVVISWKITKAQITQLSFTVDAPVKGAVPAKSATVSDQAAKYKAGTVGWTPNDSAFRGSTAYKVSIAVTVTDANYEIARGATAAVNGKTAAYSASSKTVSYTFDALAGKTLKSISVKTAPTKTVYTYGQSVDLTGLVLDLLYDDGTTGEAAYSEQTAAQFTVEPTKPKVKDKYITITYGGKSTTQDITVNKAQITSMSFTVTAPAKNGTPADSVTAGATTYEGSSVTWSPLHTKFLGGTAYTVSFDTDPTDTANYEIASTVSVKVNDADATYEKGTGKVSYTFTKTGERELVSIKVKTAPTKTEYTYGETVDLAGLKLELTYDDGTTGEAVYSEETKAQFKAAPENPKVSDKSITITYGEKTTTQGITVKKAQITSMSFDVTAPVKNGTPADSVTAGATTYEGKIVTWSPSHTKFLGGTVYTVSFDTALTDTANYELATTVSVKVNKADATYDKGTGKVSYTFAATEEKTLKSISVKTAPTKIVYTYGESVDLTGLVLDLLYDDGTTGEAAYSAQTASKFEAKPEKPAVADKSITIKYGEKTTTQGITVKKAQITSMSFDVTAPVKNGTPADSVTAGATTYEGRNVTWSPSHTKFLGGTVYTVSFAAAPTDKANYEIASTVSVKVNKADATYDKTTDKVSYTFTKTVERELVSIKVKTAPTKTVYTYGETVDLAGLKLELTYDDGTTGEAAYSAQTASKFEAKPEKPAVADKSITITYGEKTTTQSITVKKAQLTKPTAAVTEFTYDGEEKTLTVSGYDSSKMTQSGDVKATAASESYKAVYALNDKSNYEWADGTTDNVEISWKIKKAQLTKPTPSEATYVYNGDDQALRVIGYDSSKMKRSGVYTAKNVSDRYIAEYDLLDSANYEWTDGTSDTVKINWMIKPAELIAVYPGEKVSVGATPQLTVNVTGFVGGETPETAAGYIAPAIPAVDTRTKGQYTLTPAGGSADNYYFTYVSGVLEVTGGGGGGGGTGGSGGSGITETAGWSPYASPVANPSLSLGKWKLVPPTVNVWTFAGQNGQTPKNCWLYLANPGSKDGRTKGFYYFDENGYMMTGWVHSNCKWYYLTEDSAMGDLGMMETGWHTDKTDGQVYYLDKAVGCMLVGKQIIDGKEYVFNNNPSIPPLWVLKASTVNVSAAAWVCSGKGSRAPYGALISGSR